MTVIEVEGTNVQPLEVDSLQIFAGTCGLNNFHRCNNQCQNRTTLLRCCKMIHPCAGGVPHYSAGHGQSASC